jgi:hypothetical protein
MGFFTLVSLPRTSPCFLSKSQGLKTLGQSRTSVQSTQKLSLYILWSQTHTHFWALSQLKQSSLPAWTLRTHFLHLPGPTEPTHLCLPVGKFLYWRKGTIDLDSVATRLQKLSYHLWDCPGIQPKGFLGPPAWLHTPPVHR